MRSLADLVEAAIAYDISDDWLVRADEALVQAGRKQRDINAAIRQGEHRC